MLVARNIYDGYANYLLEFSQFALGTTCVTFIHVGLFEIHLQFPVIDPWTFTVTVRNYIFCQSKAF